MPEPRLNVLLFPRHEPSAQVMALIAREMEADGRYRPVVIIANRRTMWAVHDTDFTKIQPDGSPTQPDSFPPGRPKAGAKTPARASLSAITDSTLYTFFAELRYLWASLRKARKLVRQYRPAALLVMGDRHRGLEPALIKAAQEVGCPVIVVPTATSTLEGTLAHRQGEVRFQVNMPPGRLVKHLIYRFFPRQGQISEEGPVLYYRPGIVLAMAVMGVLSKNPWHIAGGASNVLAVASEFDRQKAIEAGVIPEKIAVTGHPAYDSLYDAAQQRGVLRAELQRTYHLPDDKPLLIYAVPQFAEQYADDPPAYWLAIRDTLSTLRALDASTLLSIHPKSNPDDYTNLAVTYETPILSKPLREALAAASVFVSTYSSTVEWALLLGIPTAIIDPYCHRKGITFHMYDDLPGVQILMRLDTVQSALQPLLSNEAEARVETNPVFDGQANRRIIELIATHDVACG
jgi:UDP-N-acetylglucosamine 2-epimerase